MYQIAICDDDSKFSERFQNQILEILEHLKKKGKFCYWSSFEEAKCALRQQPMIKLIFISIELKKKWGMELGKFIREELLDFQIQIVYVSHEREYVMELLNTEPLGFLNKPIVKEALMDVCKRFLRKQRENKEVYYYKNGLEIKVLLFEDILYFRSMAHKIVAYSKEEIREFYGKLGELEERAPSYFIRIHKSYLVNTYCIQRYLPDRVVLYNGEELVISRSCKEQVRAFASRQLEEM